MSSLYETLGLNETASQDEIKKAYRKLSLQYHPDRNNNSAESTTKFQSISAAYDTIGDEAKRQQYDLQAKMQGGGMHSGGMHSGGMHSGMPFHASFGHGGMPTFFTTSNNSSFDPSEILNFMSTNFFGGGGQGGSGGSGGGIKIDGSGIRVGNTIFNMDNIKQRLAKPTPIIKTETITLSKAYTGYNMPIEITRWIVEGDVKREETETIYIPIPRGIDTNEIIILREKGNILAENNKGDIKVFIKVQNDTEFVRNGLDLIMNKTISLKDALCGFTFDMTYLDGRVFKLNNNVGSIIANNYNKVIQGMGMKREDHIGNLLINFTVTFPEQLSLEQIEALQKIL